MTEALETRSIAQLARLVAVPSGAIVPIQVEGAPAGGVPVDALFGKYLAVDVSYETAAELHADLAHDANAIGLVYSDPDPTNSIYWVKSGASGVGEWVKTNIAAGPRGYTGADGIEISSLMGVPPLAPDMGTTPGNILSNNGSAKDWFGELETALDEAAAWHKIYDSLSVVFGVTDQSPSLEGGAPKILLDRYGNIALLQISVTARDKTAPVGGFTEDDVLRITGLSFTSNSMQLYPMFIEPGTGLPDGTYAGIVGDTIGFYLPGRVPVTADMVADTYYIRATGLVAIFPETNA